MKRIIILSLCLIGIGSASCENKERLEEIKAELKGEKPSDKKKEESKVNISAPAQNQAPAPVVESTDTYSSMTPYESGDYSSDYPVDTYESDFGTQYESEY